MIFQMVAMRKLKIGLPSFIGRYFLVFNTVYQSSVSENLTRN